MLSAQQRGFIESQRVARLATVDALGRPHVVPICFALDGDILYSVLDAKPKRLPVRRLRRVRNILTNPHVQVLLDRFDEDWTRLAYLQLRGEATLLEPQAAPAEHAVALRRLRERYPQYLDMPLEEAPMLRVGIVGLASWGDIAR